MNEVTGSLGSEFQRVAATFDGAVGGKAVPIANTLRGQGRPRERRFQEMLDALPAAICTADAEGRITYYNDAAAELWGHRPPLGSTEWCGSWKLYCPDGAPMAHEQCPMAMALKEDRPLRGVEIAVERPDGTRVPILAYPTPLHDEAGALTGAVNMLVDISERKHVEEQHAHLTRELHHRVKNTLATVQAIMGSTARSAETIDDFKRSLIGRIASLAKTHLLLSEEQGEVMLGDIARKELAAFDDGAEGRIRLEGPPVVLPPQMAVILGMALHELTTNAAKHGALSVHDGRVNLSWNATIETKCRRLDIDWAESGGPAVEQPARQGFGMRLINFVLPAQIGAETRIDYLPEGLRLHCSVSLPAEASL